MATVLIDRFAWPHLPHCWGGPSRQWLVHGCCEHLSFWHAQAYLYSVFGLMVMTVIQIELPVNLMPEGGQIEERLARRAIACAQTLPIQIAQVRELLRSMFRVRGDQLAAAFHAREP